MLKLELVLILNMSYLLTEKGTSGFYWGLRYSIFSFVDRCLSFFFLAIVLFVLLRYTDSDYHFGVFKFFLHISCARSGSPV